jgi:DNA replication protein DnaC
MNQSLSQPCIKGIILVVIDRLVHHAEILALKGDSYRLQGKDLASPPAAD